MTDILLIGVGNTAKDVFYFIKDYKLFNVIGFAVDPEYRNVEKFLDLPVFTIEEVNNKFNKEKVSIFIPIQWNYLNRQRKSMYLRLKAAGFHFVNIISPHSIIHSGVNIGENCWISDNVIVESNVTIGNNVFVKSRATLGHYSVIHDHSFIGIAAIIGGKSIIGEQSFVGINATVFDEVNIGNKCLIGACTFVKRSLPDFTIVKTSLTNIMQIASSESIIEEKLVAYKNIR